LKILTIVNVGGTGPGIGGPQAELQIVEITKNGVVKADGHPVQVSISIQGHDEIKKILDQLKA